MLITGIQKAALYQLVTNSKPKKDGTVTNPYDEGIGLKVYEITKEITDED